MKNLFSSVIHNYCLLLLFTILFSAANSQINTSNLTIRDTSSAIEERLVQLALQGPELAKMAHETKINEYELKAAQNAWMNLLALNVNYNEFSFAKSTTTTAYVYPRYNLGVTIPLGTILSRTAVKSAKENIEIGKNDAELLKRDLRERVLTAYKQYVAYGQLIGIQSELTNDAKTLLAQTEEKFRAGTISMEAYNQAQTHNNTAMASIVNLKLQQDLKKLELEKLIGVKLETVLKK